MTDIQKQFVEIIRAALWDDCNYRPSNCVDWDILTIMAKEQSILGIYGDYVLRNKDRFAKEGYAIPENLLIRLKSAVYQIVLLNEKTDRVLAKVVSVLNNANITSTLLKGQGLASYYPNPVLRQCGDIDLYVGEENYYKVADVLRNIATEVNVEGETSKHYHLVVDGILVEIHRTAMSYLIPKKNQIFEVNQSVGMSEPNVQLFSGIRVLTPSNHFNSVYIFNHMFNHFMTEGVGLRQICDWLFFLHTHKGTLDDKYIFDTLDGMSELVPWKIMGTILVDILGLPSDEFPLYTSNYQLKANKILAFIFKEGNFGENIRPHHLRSQNYFFAKSQSFVRKMHRYFRLMSIMPKTTLYYIISFLLGGIKKVHNDLKTRKIYNS